MLCYAMGKMQMRMQKRGWRGGGGGWMGIQTHTYNLLGPFFALNRARENGESMFGKQQAFFSSSFLFSILASADVYLRDR